MELIEETPQNYPRIRSYTPGHFQIADKDWDESVVLHQAECSAWAPRSLETLLPAHIVPLLDPALDLLLIGTGSANAVLLPSACMQVLIDAKVAYECMGTLSACRTYAVLINEGRNVKAALLVE